MEKGMLFFILAFVIISLIASQIIRRKWAFRVEPAANEMVMKNRRVGWLTVDIPADATKVDNWYCVLDAGRDIAWLFLEEIVIDRLAEAAKEPGRMVWELDILVRKEKKLNPDLKWSDIDLENKYEQPCRFIISRDGAEDSQPLNGEKVKYFFWAGFPGGFLKITGWPRIIKHKKQNPEQTGLQFERAQAQFMDWVRKIMADYHWLGGPDTPAPTNSFRTVAGCLDGESGRAPWSVGITFKSAGPKMSCLVWCVHASVPYPIENANVLYFMNQLTLARKRSFRGFSGDPKIRASANSDKSITVNQAQGHEYIIYEYNEDDLPYLGCAWDTDSRPSVGGSVIGVSMIVHSRDSRHLLEEKALPAFLGTWKAMLQSLRWPQD